MANKGTGKILRWHCIGNNVTGSDRLNIYNFTEQLRKC